MGTGVQNGSLDKGEGIGGAWPYLQHLGALEAACTLASSTTWCILSNGHLDLTGLGSCSRGSGLRAAYARNLLLA